MGGAEGAGPDFESSTSGPFDTMEYALSPTTERRGADDDVAPYPFIKDKFNH